jgi:hypothetical protein
MFVAAPLWEVLTSAEGDEAWEIRVGQLQADMETFLSARNIGPKYLFLLTPLAQGVWEIRSTQPDPQIRVLGCFLDRDVFVALDFRMRDTLGKFESQEWRAAKRGCLAAWRNLFHPWEQKKDSDIHQLVSGAINGRYFR